MKIKIDYMKTGNMILESSKKKNISIYELSEMTNINESNINKYINGEKRISLNNLITICNSLEAIIDDIIVYEMIRQ